MDGFGVEQNYKEALKWFNIAAEKNYLKAQYGIAYMILGSMGVKLSYKQAYFWLIIAQYNSPCHFSDNDQFLNYCFSNSCTDADKFDYEMVNRAISIIPISVKKDTQIIEKSNEWIKKHAEIDNEDYNKTLKSMVKKLSISLQRRTRQL